jgi:hypothetical protein
VAKDTEDDSHFGANGPFFHIIREGLKGLVDGEDCFDLLADDVVFEYVIPGALARALDDGHRLGSEDTQRSSKRAAEADDIAVRISNGAFSLPIVLVS